MNSLKTKSTTIYSWYTPGFWPRFFIHMRPYLLFISGIGALTGISLTANPDITTIILAMVPFFLAYGLGQAMTDVFQVDTDSISAPYRPLVKGEIKKQEVFIISLILLLTGIAILMAINPWLGIPGLLAVIGLVSYTPFKRTWWGGPFWNSWIVALLPFMGYMISQVTFSEAVSHIFKNKNFLFSMIAVFFAYMNFVVGGYFKDISADAQSDYKTFQVRFGWTAAAIYSLITALCAIAATLLAIQPVFSISISTIPVIIIFLLAVILNLYAQIRLFIVKDENNCHTPIAHIVRSFILYSATIILSFKPQWLIAIIIYYVLFEITLKLRPAKSQI